MLLYNEYKHLDISYQIVSSLSEAQIIDLRNTINRHRLLTERLFSGRASQFEKNDLIHDIKQLESKLDAYKKGI